MSDVPRWIGVLGAPWLLAGFAVGTRASRRFVAGVAGSVALVVGVGVYYFTMWQIEHRSGFDYAFWVGIAWAAVAALAGTAFGVAGFLWKHGSDRLARVAVVLLAGMLAGEALYGAMTWQYPTAHTVVALEAVTAVAAILLFSRSSRLLTFAGTIVAILPIVVAETATTHLLHSFGWAGA